MEITPPPTDFYNDDIAFEQRSAHGVFIYEQHLAKWVVLSGSHKELGRMHKRSGFGVRFTFTFDILVWFSDFENHDCLKKKARQVFLVATTDDLIRQRNEALAKVPPRRPFLFAFLSCSLFPMTSRHSLPSRILTHNLLAVILWGCHLTYQLFSSAHLFYPISQPHTSC